MHEKLDAREELLSKSQLYNYYGAFRQQFSPEVLQALEGKALLERNHGRRGSRDSLVYWLEFKNDEEFPSRFDSISGGSAVKVDIHYRDDTQTWRTGSPQKQEGLSVEETIDYVRKRRDRLVCGVELIHDLLRMGTLALERAAGYVFGYVVLSDLKLAQLNVNALPLCGEEGKLRSMITEHDIVTRSLALGKDSNQTRAAKVGYGKPVAASRSPSAPTTRGSLQSRPWPPTT